MSTAQQEKAFKDLLNRNYPIINTLCNKYCRDNDFYFDELRQECAMAIWKEFNRDGLDSFRGDSSESTWIYKISFHAIAQYLRNPKHQELLSFKDLYDPELLADNDKNNDWQLLDELRQQLNNRERTMLDHLLNEDSYSTIAHIEGISQSNARKRMSRLINKLKSLSHK